MPSQRRPSDPPPRESRHFAVEEATRANERLQSRLSELQSLDPKQPDYLRNAQILLDNSLATVRDVFGGSSDESATFSAALIVFQASGSVFDDPYRREAQERLAIQERVEEATARLKYLRKVVDEKTIAGVTARPGRSAPETSRRVFLVHGRDERIKEAVARVLQQLDLQPIILHEQPDRGRTIIEKFEDYADVGFVVVLMTADDLGGPQSTPSGSYRPRSRQNVLLEMGFFLGLLGRSRVCVLYEVGVEMPTDYSGVLYKKLDDEGAWRFHLGKEIQAAGIDVDLNQL